MLITFDTDIMSEVVQSSEGLCLTKEAEAKIAEFKRIQNKVDEIEKALKEKLVDVALSFDPNFSSISGDNAKISYSYHGVKYTVDESKVSYIPDGLVTSKVKYSVETKAIELYEKNMGGLPEGIYLNDRKKSISITLKEK